jgi:flagellar motor switch protein FliG
VTEPPLVPPPQLAFEQLLSLSAADFFSVFEEADPRVVMLALAGAPRRLFERYLARFSTDRALEFERHLEQLRPLRLRDVEAAQQELATLAGRRWQAAKSAAERSRRFAAAA